MKKVLTILALMLSMAVCAQTQSYQKEKGFVPYITGGAGYGGGELWTSFDIGAMNKNTMLAFGVASHLWDGNYLIPYFSVGKRIVTVGRFEGWGALTVMTAWKENIPFKFEPMVKIAYPFDKALTLFTQINTVLTAPDYKYVSHSIGGGVTIPIRGNPHSSH